MNSHEKKHAIIIAIMIALRMYGLFLILPVFAVYGVELTGSTPVLLGLAIGVYGLTQALLQVPMGFLSDIWGRKKILALGLLLFIAGSVLAALSDSIEMVILGRLIQGMGAIASTGMALIADVSRPEQRGKMMGFVGAGIGFSFMLAFMTGPLIADAFGLRGLFVLTAILASLALLLLLAVDEPAKRARRDYRFREMLECVRQPHLLFLDSGVFVLHAVMTALFVVLPVSLVEQMNWAVTEHWKLYVPVLLASLLIMVPMLIFQEKLKAHRLFMLGAFLLLGLNFLLFWAGLSVWVVVVISLVVYFGLFNFLEAAMPALLSKQVAETHRGAAMGVYSSSQFFGAFIGGVAGGWLLSYDSQAVYLAMALILVVQMLLGLWLKPKPADRSI